jgi:dolichol-phosphate mannosyltransferase
MTMLALNGIQLVMLGVIGLYLGRVFEEVKKRPLYIAREEIGIAVKRRVKALKRTSAGLVR